MTILFCVHSIADTDLALQTAIELRAEGYKTAFLPLGTAAEDRVEKAATLAPISKISVTDLIKSVQMPQRCTHKQLQRILHFIHQKKFTHIYVGIPSERNQEIGLQIAERIHSIPLLVASELMFRPHPEHSIWRHLPKLKKNDNLHWAVPLKKAQIDFGLEKKRCQYTGHLSIDRALLPVTDNIAALKTQLGIFKSEEKLAVMSSTTQPMQCDLDFLELVLNELPNHPKIQLRLSLHPGIKDLDTYLDKIERLYLTKGSPKRFQIIFPPSWAQKLKHPELNINKEESSDLFLFTEIGGPQAAIAADMVLQAVSGALVNEAVLRGKPVYTLASETEIPYLPSECYSSSPEILFRSSVLPRMDKADLDLNEETAAQATAKAILG